MDIDLTRLRHLLAVARTRSFSRAAEELNITQPALSRSIASFEERFGLRLFDRSRSGVVPTSAGRLVIAEAQKVLGAARDLDRNMKLYAGGEAGQVAIGMGPMMASHLLPSLGKHLLQTRPHLQLKAAIRTPDLLLQDLLEDRLEMIIGNSLSLRDVAELAITEVGSIPMAFMARSGHPLENERGVTLADLQRFPIASASELPGLTMQSGAFICDNYHILRDLVLETDCVWLSSTALAGQDIAEGRMAVLTVADFPLFQSDISLIRHKGRTPSPAAEAVADYVRTLLGARG